MAGHHHRSSGLKQANKKNKRTKASKRSVTRLAGGKVEGGKRGQLKQHLLAHNKADRRHIQTQRRDTKHAELLRRKRGLDGGPAPPRIIGIISLSESVVIEEKLRSLILGQADRVMRPFGSDNNSTITVKNDTHKKDGNLTILTNSTAFHSHYSGDDDDAAVMAALDLCRVCDMIVFVVDGNEENQEAKFVGMSIGGDDRSHSTNKTNSTASNFDHIISERGDRILAAVKGQGLPRIATILAKTKNEEDPGDDQMTTQSAKSIRRGNLKRRTDLKKYVSRFATTEFGDDNDKMIEVNLVETSTEGAMEDDDSVKIDPEEHATNILAVSLVRTLCQISASPSKWVSNVPRAYVLSDNHIYDPEKQELTLTGYVRGSVPFDSNSAIHVPNLGTFGCKSVSRAKQPYRTGKVEISDDVIAVDPMEREALGMFATPDALDGEQNLIGFDEHDEEIDDSGEKSQEKDNDFSRPAGWSDYQSAWLDAVDGDDMNADFDHGELAEEMNKKSSGSVAPNTMDLDEANHISEEERKALQEQRRKEEHEHHEFPDEIQVNEGEKARDRFPRYRSLKSFRQSHWDPKENLPDSYAAIYHFKSFKATQLAVMGEMKDVVKAADVCNGSFWDGEKKTNDTPGDANMDDDDEDDMLKGCVPFGSYITVTLEGVKPTDYSTVAPTALLTAVTLLPHENKVSVLHMGLSHGNNCDVSEDTPVRSKDVLTFRCGWRTWTGRPIFSQNNLNCDKHKFERFLPQTGSFFAASVFGPVTYTPCPVLVFRDLNGKRELVASGSMMNADADRIVIKRIILTGYPVRVHKRHATVKYMFYDPEDVKWFKPAGLVTKHGLNGTIEDCVGEHGTMKCLFNAPIKQHDTVCLPLYKRVYPKFETSQAGGDNGGTVRSMRATDSTLVVK